MSALKFVVDVAGNALAFALDFGAFVAFLWNYDFSDPDNSQYLGDL